MGFLKVLIFTLYYLYKMQVFLFFFAILVLLLLIVGAISCYWQLQFNWVFPSFVIVNTCCVVSKNITYADFFYKFPLNFCVFSTKKNLKALKKFYIWMARDIFSFCLSTYCMYCRARLKFLCNPGCCSFKPFKIFFQRHNANKCLHFNFVSQVYSQKCCGLPISTEHR